MSVKALRNVFIWGTVVFVLVLVGLTVNSLSQVTAKRTPELTDQVVNGKKVWQHKNCDDCHTILGIGGYFAPDLTKEAVVRDPQFLTAWLKNPQAVKPGTTMPDQHLTDRQVADLVAFLQWVSKIDTNNWPPKPSGGGGGPSGALLMQQKGCMACHMINGQGASGPGPDLSHIGSQPYGALSNTADFLYKWIENPSALKPGTLMPAIPMTQDERNAIVQYLVGLK